MAYGSASRLTRSDYEEFLVSAYFGYGRDYLWLCIDRAYRDFNRTMRGFGKLDGKSEVRQQARQCVREQLISLRELELIEVGQFDHWHRQACEALSVVYRENGYPSFYVGQAQKWLNMTLKYIFTLGVERIAGFDGAYAFCHAPLDNILIGQLSKYDFPSLPTRWSRIKEYEQYLTYQQWIRERFQSPPLDVEFLLWMGKSPD